MKSLATVSLGGTVEQKLAAIAAAGFDGLELGPDDVAAWPGTPESLRDHAAELGLRPYLFQPLRDFEAVPPRLLAANLRRAEEHLELMRRLGVDLLLVCSNVSTGAQDDDALAAAQLHALADLAAAYGVRVAYEALAWGRHVNRYRHAWRIVQAADHPGLGLCLDSFHILATGDDPAAIAGIPAGKLFFLQLADAPRLDLDLLRWSRNHRCLPGQGDLDVTGLTRRTLAAGYRGPLSLEIFNPSYRAADPHVIAARAAASLDRLAAAAAPAATAGGAAAMPPGTATPPAP
ncbi:sugar phosphate isomerase/epimerase family protein [Bailinhaonella thermotolerans]|uniref:Sugar phosphate isomerase/epimerase n=1 Tax=Bailinhaonella thermotolerans TaxID=1070861 RepID=A0A3A4AC89_9ACTN|nr:sugar phosphate isomerase/epimerase [Bailinhaonella thermotolerans]RJL23173.1 sugar phosphate isomerase/epimerase [Bailinhaonella thermotolerans]